MTRARFVLVVAAVSAVACSPPAPPPAVVRTVAVPAAPPAVQRSEPPAPVAQADAGSPSAAPPDRPPTAVEQALRAWSAATQCDSFDYHPDGGIRSFWCHRPAGVTLAALRSAAGIDVFASGPHRDALDLEASTFGHYDPAFVQWLADHAVSERGSAGQRATEAAYDAHLKPLAEVFWKTYEKATREKDCFEREKKSYADAIARKKSKGFVERWFYFMNPWFCRKDSRVDNFSFYSDNGFDAGVNGNVTKTVVGFWLRRSLDGTMEAFGAGLKKLLAAYEPELVARPTLYADPDAIERVLDAAVKASSGCMRPPASRPKEWVDVTLARDGHVRARLAFTKLRGTPLDACVAAAFERQPVPAFDGSDLKFGRLVTFK